MPSYTTPDDEREIAPRFRGPLPPLSDDTKPNRPYGEPPPRTPLIEPEIAPPNGVQPPGAFIPPTGTVDDDTQPPSPPIAMPNATFPWRPSYVSPPGEQAPVDQYNYTPHGDDGTY